MRFSNNTIIIGNYPAKSEYLLYNIRTQAMVKINQELNKLLSDFDNQAASLKEKYSHNIEALHKMGIIVKDDEEDRKILELFLRQLKFSRLKEILPVSIVTTYSCNFKCVYCFEESSRNNIKMDFSTAVYAMDWIKRALKKDGYKKLYIIFYGGEPLLNPKILEYTARKMQGYCLEQGIEFKFMLQTNGYLLTPDLVDRYLKLGLAQARISLDGIGAHHDQRRPLRGGGATFDTIVKNIFANIGKVKISISTGYDKENIGHIEEMLQFFDEKNILPQLGEFIFSPIHPTLGPKGSPENIQQCSSMCNYEDENFIEAVSKIRKLLRERGLPQKSGMSISACPLTRSNAAVTIDPEGLIYKCNTMLGHPEFAVGNVQDKDYNNKYKEFLDLDTWRKCPKDCAYIPMCSGGCRMMSFLRNKDFTHLSCLKGYLDKMVPEFIKEDYEALMAKRENIE